MLTRDAIIERLREQANEIINVKLPAIDELREKAKVSRNRLKEMSEQIEQLLNGDQTELRQLKALTEEFDALNIVYEAELEELDALITSVQMMRG